jgi:hypothetical protein
MQPDGVRVAGDEFIDGHAFDSRRAWHSLLFAVNEDDHVLLSSLAPRTLFGGGELTLAPGRSLILLKA